MKRPILFLDIDGVIAPHREPGEDSGISREHVSRLLTIIDSVPAIGIVLSSAWRYMGHGRDSVYGQCLRVSHHLGIEVVARTIGALRLEERCVPVDRDALISEYVAAHQLTQWVAVDDLLEIERLPEGHWVRTDGRVGLTKPDVDRVVELFRWQENEAARGVAGDRCEVGNECGRLGCPWCQQ